MKTEKWECTLQYGYLHGLASVWFVSRITSCTQSRVATEGCSGPRTCRRTMFWSTGRTSWRDRPVVAGGSARPTGMRPGVGVEGALFIVRDGGIDGSKTCVRLVRRAALWNSDQAATASLGHRQSV